VLQSGALDPFSALTIERVLPPSVAPYHLRSYNQIWDCEISSPHRGRIAGREAKP